MKERGFLLLEALIAVAIFAVGVIALGKCFNNCTLAERLRQEDALASRALENRMMEIEVNSASFQNAGMETLGGAFTGIKMKQETLPLRLRNENGQELTGLYTVTLTATWDSNGDPHERSLTFYVRPRQF